MKNNLLTWELLPMTLASKSWQGHLTLVLTSSRDGSTKLRLDVGSLLVRWRGQTEEGIQGSGRWGCKYEFILWDWRTHHLCFLEGHGEESSLRQDHKEWTAKEGRCVFGYTFVPFRSRFPASKTNLLLPSWCSISFTQAVTSSALVWPGIPLPWAFGSLALDLSPRAVGAGYLALTHVQPGSEREPASEGLPMVSEAQKPVEKCFPLLLSRVDSSICISQGSFGRPDVIIDH